MTKYFGIGIVLMVAIATCVILPASPAAANEREIARLVGDLIDIVVDVVDVLMPDNGRQYNGYGYQYQLAPTNYQVPAGWQLVPMGQPMMPQQMGQLNYGLPQWQPPLGYIRVDRVAYPILPQIIDQPPPIAYGLNWQGRVVGPLGGPTPGANDGQRLINSILTGAPLRNGRY